MTVNAETEQSVVLTVSGTADINVKRTTDIDVDGKMTVNADNLIKVKLHPTAEIDVNPAISKGFRVTLRNVEEVTTTIDVSAVAEIRVCAKTHLNATVRSDASGTFFVESNAGAAVTAKSYSAVDMIAEPGADITTDADSTADVETRTVTEIGPIR